MFRECHALGTLKTPQQSSIRVGSLGPLFEAKFFKQGVWRISFPVTGKITKSLGARLFMNMCYFILTNPLSFSYSRFHIFFHITTRLTLRWIYDTISAIFMLSQCLKMQ